MQVPDFDDKDLVIFAVFIITIFAMFILGAESKEVVTNCFSGLFGLAVGRGLAEKK